MITNQVTKELEKKNLRTPDWGLVFFAFIGVAGITLVIFGNMCSYWVGIGVGSGLAVIGFLYFVNSSKYVRDIWELEIKISNTEGEKDRLVLSQDLSMKIGYRDVDRNWGMACLTLSAGVLGLTAIMVL